MKVKIIQLFRTKLFILLDSTGTQQTNRTWTTTRRRFVCHNSISGALSCWFSGDSQDARRCCDVVSKSISTSQQRRVSSGEFRCEGNTLALREGMPNKVNVDTVSTVCKLIHGRGGRRQALKVHERRTFPIICISLKFVPHCNCSRRICTPFV